MRPSPGNLIVWVLLFTLFYFCEAQAKFGDKSSKPSVSASHGGSFPSKSLGSSGASPSSPFGNSSGNGGSFKGGRSGIQNSSPHKDTSPQGFKGLGSGNKQALAKSPLTQGSQKKSQTPSNASSNLKKLNTSEGPIQGLSSKTGNSGPSFGKSVRPGASSSSAPSGISKFKGVQENSGQRSGGASSQGGGPLASRLRPAQNEKGSPSNFADSVSKGRSRFRQPGQSNASVDSAKHEVENSFRQSGISSARQTTSDSVSGTGSVYDNTYETPRGGTVENEGAAGTVSGGQGNSVAGAVGEVSYTSPDGSQYSADYAGGALKAGDTTYYVGAVQGSGGGVAVTAGSVSVSANSDGSVTYSHSGQSMTLDPSGNAYQTSYEGSTTVGEDSVSHSGTFEGPGGGEVSTEGSVSNEDGRISSEGSVTVTNPEGASYEASHEGSTTVTDSSVTHSGTTTGFSGESVSTNGTVNYGDGTVSHEGEATYTDANGNSTTVTHEGTTSVEDGTLEHSGSVNSSSGASAETEISSDGSGSVSESGLSSSSSDAGSDTSNQNVSSSELNDAVEISNDAVSNVSAPLPIVTPLINEGAESSSVVQALPVSDSDKTKVSGKVWIVMMPYGFISIISEGEFQKLAMKGFFYKSYCVIPYLYQSDTTK